MTSQCNVYIYRIQLVPCLLVQRFPKIPSYMFYPLFIVNKINDNLQCRLTITFNPYLWIGVWFLPILYTSIQVYQQVFLIKIFEDLNWNTKTKSNFREQPFDFWEEKKVPFKQTLNRKTYMEVTYLYLHRKFRVKIFAFVDLKNYLSKPNHSAPSPRVKWLVS